MKKIIVFLLSIVLFIPFSVNALNKEYNDVVSNIVGVKQEDNIINIYLL